MEYNNLGSVYDANGKYNHAIEYYQKSKVNFSHILGSEHPYVAMVNNNLGLAYIHKHEYSESIKYLIQSENIYKKNTSDRIGYLNVLYNISFLYKKKEDNKNEIKYLSKAINLILKYRLEMTREKSAFTSRYNHIFLRLIQLQLKNKKEEDAFITSEKMRGLSIVESLNLDKAHSLIKSLQKETQELITLKKEISSLKSQLKFDFQNRNNLESLKENIKKINRKQQLLDSKETELINKHSKYKRLRSTKIPSIDFLKKNRLAKKNKLLVQYKIIPNENGKKQIHAFIITKNNFEHIILNKNNKKLKQKVKTLRKIISNYPKEREKFVVLKNSEGQNILCDKIECYNAKVGEKVYKKFIVNNSIKNQNYDDFYLKFQKKNFNNKTIIKNILLGKKINHGITNEEAKNFMNIILNEVYLDLIKPLEKYFDTDSIVIVPDSYLYTIPFSALKDDNGKYMIQKYNISIIHSATVWNTVIENKQSLSQKNELLAFGNPVYTKGHSNTINIKGNRRIEGFLSKANKLRGNKLKKVFKEMKNLPGSLKEVKVIEKLIYKKPTPEHIYLGVRANKSEVYNLQKDGKLDDYKIIHFSAHGLFFGDSPEMNSLVLTGRRIAKKYKNETLKDYERKWGKITKDRFLRQSEVLELDIKAEIVIMSACKTSLGVSRIGEGMVGLPQAFLTSGSTNVLATLWSVDDTGTVKFFKDFYPKIISSNKQNYSQILQQTQVEIIENDNEFSDPFYWSPFVLYGE